MSVAALEILITFKLSIDCPNRLSKLIFILDSRKIKILMVRTQVLAPDRHLFGLGLTLIVAFRECR